MIPGGFSGGDEPDGSAKFITAFFRAPEVTEAVRELLQARDGLMLGICNGFQALIKLGLVPYGDIVDADGRDLPDADLQHHRPPPEPPGAHPRRLATSRRGCPSCEVGDMHTVAISPRRGPLRRHRRGARGQLVANGQIATQYVDAGRRAQRWTSTCNPNGSVARDRGHHQPRRPRPRQDGPHRALAATGLYKNVPGNKFQPLFEGGVSYFTE